MSERLKFIREFVRRPRQTGAVAPSSPALAKAITDWIDWTEVMRVIELGPGTGSITEVILQWLQPGAEYLGIDANPRMAQELRRRFPGVQVVVDKAANTEEICRSRGWAEVDAIVSGLPFVAFPEAQKRRIILAAANALRSGGYFTTFQYVQGLLLPASRKFQRLLEENFARVERSDVTWLNFPPAIFYRCRK